MALINTKYDKSNFVKNRKYYNFKYGIRSVASFMESKHEKFVGIYNQHITQPYIKEYFDKIWNECFYECDRTCNNKFRSTTDISHYAVRYMQLLDGVFEGRKLKFGKSFELSNNNELIYNQINKNKYKVICINDSDDSIDFENIKNKLINIFEKKFNNKSKYER